MEKFNYAATASPFTDAIPALNLSNADVVFPVKDACVDYGSYKHLPDSIPDQQFPK